MSNDKTPAQAAAEEYPPMPFTNVPVHDLNGGKRAAFIRGAEWQASQAPSPSLTVDQIMKVVKYDTTPYILEKTWPNELPELWQRIHDRLTALLDQTPSPR